MKKLIISVVSTVMMIGAGAAFRSDQDIKLVNMKMLTKKNQRQMKFRLRKKIQPIKGIQKKRVFLLAQKNKMFKVMILQRVV